MKCMPITFSGLSVFIAILPMLILDVLLANIAFFLQILSSFLKISNFISSISGTASITISELAAPSNLRDVFISSKMVFALSLSILSFSTNFLKLFSIVSIPLSMNSDFTSIIKTSNPDIAATWAIPAPI